MARRRVVDIGRRRYVQYVDRRGRIRRNVPWSKYLQGKEGARAARVREAKRGLARLAMGRIPLVGDALDAYEAARHLRTIASGGKASRSGRSRRRR